MPSFRCSTPDRTRAVSQNVGAHTDALQPRHEFSKKMTQTTCRRPRHYLLQRLVYDLYVSDDTGSSIRQLL